MGNLEHLIENGIWAIQSCDGYDDWYSSMKNDLNWSYVSWLSEEDLWTICQYVVYTWGAMRCEECKMYDCSGCKYIESDRCNDCKRKWVDKHDYYELNMYADTFGTVDDIKDYIEEVIDAPDSNNEWDRLWRWAERNRRR